MLSSLLSILAGYAFGMMRFRGDQALFYLFLLGLMVPLESTVVPLYYDLRDLGLTDTYAALIFPQVGVSVAFGTFWMRAFFRSVPRSLVEAARLDGSSSWSTLWRVVLPVGRPAVLTMMVLVFMWTWNEFLLALVMVSDEDLRTAPLGLAFFSGRNTTDFALLAAGSVIVATPVVVALRLPPAPLHPRHAQRSREGLMAGVSFESVSKRFDAVEAVRELTLSAADGEFLVLVGPSGSGKTTALRMLAGLESVTDGEIRIGERVVNRVAPRERDIAMVFQDYALYPQMTVYDNLAFGLRRRKAPKEQIDAQVRRAAGALELDALLDRRPRQLSGGQQQRVALGRALVRDPQVFLMDEPLSNLDAKLRVQTRGEIKRLQKEIGTTTVYVTHDQVEAMTMGDRIAVMNDGRLEQVGTPARGLRGARERVRRRLRRLPGDELRARRPAPARARRARRGDRGRAPGARAPVAGRRRPPRPARRRGRVRRGARARDLPRRPPRRRDAARPVRRRPLARAARRPRQLWPRPRRPALLRP